MMNNPILFYLERNKSDLVIIVHATEEVKQVVDVFSKETEDCFHGNSMICRI